MSTARSDACAPDSDLEPQSWILRAEMLRLPQGVSPPRSRSLVLSRLWRRARRLRAARRAGWLIAVAATFTVVQPGWGQAPTSGASQPTRTSQPKPSAGLITFYLALPAHANSLVKDSLAASIPSSAHYKVYTPTQVQTAYASRGSQPPPDPHRRASM
jgi:hypothetical protein